MQQDKNITSNNMKPIVNASLSYHWHSINTTNLTESRADLQVLQLHMWYEPQNNK